MLYYSLRPLNPKQIQTIKFHFFKFPHYTFPKETKSLINLNWKILLKYKYSKQNFNVLKEYPFQTIKDLNSTKIYII